MTIVAGNWDEGFLTQLFVISSGQAQPIHQPFRLPAAPQIERAYQRWRHDYQAIGDHHRDNSRIALNGGQVTNISASNCYDSYRDLKALLETWFNQSEFLALQIGMLTHLPTGMPTRLVLSTDHPSLWKLPWHLWPLYANRPDVEIVLDAKVNSLPSQWGETVRILVIEGNTDGIDITPDLACIDRIPNATIEILKIPTRDQLNSQLRSPPWDIIIYAGHSCSENNRDGVIVHSDDPTRVIRISDLEASIRSAVAQGLKLMIFNSCDGLGLTQPLLGFGVPNVIVMRESVPDPVAHQFLANFFESFAHQRLPLSLAMRQARVQLKGDEVAHQFPGSQDLPILYQGAYSEDLRWPEPRPEPVALPIEAAPSHPIDTAPRRLPLGPIAAAAILGFTTLVFLPKIWPEIHNISQNISQNLCQLPGLGPCSPEVIRQLNSTPVADRLSLGDKILIKQAQNPPLKEQAAQAMRQGGYREAVRLYSKSLEQFKNDPEAVIYLNNAHAIQGPYLKVALSVPIGSNPKVAQQMMRGIAHYQTEVNQGEGINGKQLVVQLANDDNDEGPAKAIAKVLVADPTILAIIGHNATNASLAAAPIYQAGSLPMVMPTSVATQLSGIGSYIFRASATAKTAAETEADYLIKQGYRNLGICYDSRASDNQSFRDELGLAFENRGGRLSSLRCDVTIPGFDPSQAVDTAIAQKIDVLALAPHIDHIDRILPIAVAAHGKVPLFSSSTMNTDEVLSGGSAVDGLVMPTAWHPWQADGQVFAKKAEKFWGGRIIWRTAMTYDATAAVVAGLRRSSTRDGLQQALASSGFEAQGSGAPFRFNSKTHDRIMGMSMLQIYKEPNAPHGYDFRPISVRPSAN